jgi:hypothetical protein
MISACATWQKSGERAHSSASQHRGSFLLVVAPIALVVGGVSTMSIMNRRPLGQARRRSVIATRSSADKRVADALAAMVEQGG